jgi:hypothetical protein
MPTTKQYMGNKRASILGKYAHYYLQLRNKNIDYGAPFRMRSETETEQ